MSSHQQPPSVHTNQKGSSLIIFLLSSLGVSGNGKEAPQKTTTTGVETNTSRESDSLFLIQTILPQSSTHSEQMTTTVGLTGRVPATIRRAQARLRALRPSDPLRRYSTSSAKKAAKAGARLAPQLGQKPLFEQLVATRNS